MSSVQQRVSEYGKIAGGRKQAGVSGNSTQYAGVFILHFTLNDAMPKVPIVGCRGD